MRGIKWCERLTSRIYPNPLTRFMSLSLSFDSCPSLNSSHTHPNKFHRCCCSTIMQIRSLFRKIRSKRERVFFLLFYSAGTLWLPYCCCSVFRLWHFGNAGTKYIHYIFYIIRCYSCECCRWTSVWKSGNTSFPRAAVSRNMTGHEREKSGWERKR